ncbi:aldo/keto reductase [Marinobacter pelagius]|uniref:Spore coat polysaccharide biosynthesis protein SpsF n=1 Tax=Marinobacter pelagius TaxID=379482 RepID=A0A1I4TZC9_9GAMM|nr:aldo/keto reductase [Marinobacter pelagius]SFM81961.1 spore coat polysaccharide biosynthesis protein SpsF [Marinobacter pelagius]
MTATLLLQARTSSSRLPGKVLLPVGGMPLVVLAARRAGNTGHRVLVVTSHESSDDVLCDVLQNWSTDCFRGDLENTLKRFVDALEGVPDEHVVVRLTGDNVFPDGRFIDEMLEDFESRNVAYLCCGGESSGLPYGVSAEITRARFLREAHRNTDSSADREHVTPWVIRHYGRNTFDRYHARGMAQYRCTVDTLDDYLLVSKVFAGTGDPDYVPLEALLEKLKQATADIVTPVPAGRMVLGTAQFGLDYGIANREGRPGQDVVTSLVRTAISNGVEYLDTARAYGDSETVVGKALAGGWGSRVRVITKLSPLADCPADASPDVARAFAERSVYQSCHALGVSSLDVLMLHRASHQEAFGGAVWDALLGLQQRGVVGELGVSVQSPEEALAALEHESVCFIQLPFNILDYRWDEVVEKVAQVRRNRSVVVHARSALLQGLLTTDAEGLWRRARCANASEVGSWLRARAAEYTNGDVVELCLRFVFSQPWIDGVVVGVDTREQLVDNLIRSGAERWDDNELTSILRDRPRVSENTLDPATWETAND